MKQTYTRPRMLGYGEKVIKTHARLRLSVTLTLVYSHWVR